MDLPPAIAAAILNEIDLDTAIAVHEGWKRQLQNHLNGQPDDNFCQEIVCLDDQCDLGQWLHGPATERLGQYPLFSVLIARHKYFHEQAGTVLALAHAGKREDALKVMEGGYRHASVQVILQLKALKRGLRR
ncbi:CZB domain-containing protein [Rhodoferax sp.]|uniref:CZB domain-containing protein n=1 Tax=Rhodoferax sp. TaxID=50421 RepID=UPI002843285F|nr:CZB domain-containing protein [Rhodoferax sp.]MDR3368811.1 CZB domain-containing protein [Rhodoferax sp.]